MEVWNGMWKKILQSNGICNERFLVWNGNGMEENCQYGIWTKLLSISFCTMPCLPVTFVARSNFQLLYSMFVELKILRYLHTYTYHIG